MVVDLSLDTSLGLLMNFVLICLLVALNVFLNKKFALFLKDIFKFL